MKSTAIFRTTKVAAAATALTALLAACSGMGEMMGMDAMKGKGAMAPSPDAQSVLAHLKSVDYARNWKFYPGKGKLYKGVFPHGMLLTTYVNGPAHKALSARAASMPNHSMIVKENYMPDGKLAAVTVMYKSSGYNPSGGDWFWLKQAADGKVEASGKVAGCIGCHTPSRRDYVLTPLN